MVTLHYRGKQLRIQRCSYYTRDLIHLTFTWEESKEIRKPNSEFIHMSRSFWLNIFKLNLWREAWVWVLFCELVVELSKVGHHRKFVRTKKRTFQEISMFFWTLVKEVSRFFRTLFWVKSCLDTWTKSSTSRRAGIPSSLSATPKARAQFLGMRLTLKVKVLEEK